MSAADDLQQLVEAALAADFDDARAGKHKICIRREFDAPLSQTMVAWQTTKGTLPEWYDAQTKSGDDTFQRVQPQLAQRLQRGVEHALSGKVQVTRATAINTVPKPLILDQPKSDQESECEREMPHALESPMPNGPEEVALSRPVFANGFAFVEYANSCGGLCYGSSLKAFQKRDGKWTYIAWLPLAVG